MSAQEGHGSQQEDVDSKGAEEEEENEEDDQEDQEQRHLFNAWTHLLHARQPALAHGAVLDMYAPRARVRFQRARV